VWEETIVLRNGLLWLSEQPGVFNFIKNNGLARRFASRFVAGETLDSAVAAVQTANQADLTATLDLLGESVSTREEAESARAQVSRILERIDSDNLDANVSIKLTQMGLDIDEVFCADNVRQLLEVARQLGIFVRIDMESAAYTERTLRLFTETLYPVYGDLVGTVIQTALYRSSPDIKELVKLGARVRLVKGAYMEPEEIAFPDKRDVDRAFADLTEVLLSEGNYPAIATHDVALIDHTREYAAANGITPDRFEFQMLYGIRRDLQTSLREEGYNVRIYVPFGTQWYPYLMRRLAERPANLAFIVGNVFKESVPGR
jgi:proline dehydrogenase